ncbi:MAG: hypothetical protein HOY69_18300 [Streptomyces sp.]|nr:hypothetical protein [Streptomyces sp.]
MTDSGDYGSDESSEGAQPAPAPVKRKMARQAGPPPKRQRVGTGAPVVAGDSSSSSQGSGSGSSSSQGSGDDSSSGGWGDDDGDSAGSQGSGSYSSSSQGSGDGDSTDDYRPVRDSSDASEEGSGEPTSDSGGVDEDAVLACVQRFVDAAVTWCEDNGDRIEAAYESAGGWELWLEVELYLHLRGADIKVSRQPPYQDGGTGRSRADLYLEDTVVVELKAETETEAPDAFRARVVGDRNKIDNGAGGTPFVVVAFACSQESSALLAQEFTCEDGVEAGPFVRIFYDTTVAL